MLTLLTRYASYSLYPLLPLQQHLTDLGAHPLVPRRPLLALEAAPAGLGAPNIRRGQKNFEPHSIKLINAAQRWREGARGGLFEVSSGVGAGNSGDGGTALALSSVLQNVIGFEWCAKRSQEHLYIAWDFTCQIPDVHRRFTDRC